MTTKKVQATFTDKNDSNNLKYSLKQYEDLIVHMWRQYLDLEHDSIIPETKLIRFLRDNKILAEQKELDEMYKQCLISRKTEKIGVGSPVSFATYKRLFQKPLMLIGMENAL